MTMHSGRDWIHRNVVRGKFPLTAQVARHVRPCHPHMAVVRNERIIAKAMERRVAKRFDVP